MKFRLPLVCAVLCSVPALAQQPKRTDPIVRVTTIAERIEWGQFHSRVLGRTKGFCAVLPEGYRRTCGDWPVLFLLHGRGRNERTLIDDRSCRESLLQAPFVVILPQGDDGWYIDSPVRTQDRYASYLAEVIQWTASRYRLSDSAAKRAIAGWSMGGYGAPRFAQTRPGRFGLVGSIIGLLDFPRTGLPPGQSYPVPVERFGKGPAVWARFNPIHSVEKLHGSRIVLIAADEAFDRTMNENFRRELSRCGLQADWILLSGGHTFPVVRQALPILIDRVARFFRCHEKRRGMSGPG
ncbi:MAG: hypothetical protein GXP27_16775 [Planctomycetes bacterium]|nr:hypothetical protein [Planctomycetota bacterium]